MTKNIYNIIVIQLQVCLPRNMRHLAHNKLINLAAECNKY